MDDMDLISNTGWTDEARDASLAVRQAKARARREARDRMFAEQEARAGERFVGNWYPRGKDGAKQDPHVGVTAPDARYGYVEGTIGQNGETLLDHHGQPIKPVPRKEPLYDQNGRAIIPRRADDWFPERKWALFDDGAEELRAEREVDWLERSERAEKKWGPFGKKKRWLDAHPEKTEADWEEGQRAEERAWREEREREDGGDGRE